MSECEHLQLRKFKVGERSWYECENCLQKFNVELWDGKVAELPNVLTKESQ